MQDKIATQEGQITEFKTEFSGVMKAIQEKQELISIQLRTLKG